MRIISSFSSVISVLVTFSLGVAGCECTLPGQRQADGRWTGPDCLKPGAPKCCGTTVCRATGPLPGSAGVCMPVNACLPERFGCGFMNPDGSTTACCAGLRCLAGICEAPPLCSARPVINAGERCCGSTGLPVGPVCNPPTGGTCSCAILPPPCAPAGTMPVVGINQTCCEPALESGGICCLPPGAPAMTAAQCCSGAPFNASTGRCSTCVTEGNMPGVGQTCCGGLSNVGGVCQAPCVPGAACRVAACDGVTVPGNFPASCDAAEPVCIADPATVVCRGTGGDCGASTGGTCVVDSDCGAGRYCSAAHLEVGDGLCKDWLGNSNQASTSCWLPSDRGVLLCRDGTRILCPAGTPINRCPNCPTS